MQHFNFDRDELLKFLPNGNSAEVGVAKGKFSLIILENNNPKKLLLIDAWKNFDIGYHDSNMVLQVHHDKRYANVVKNVGKFENVQIIRELSTEAANKLADKILDWVYIDADHSYKGCLQDLEAYKHKVKDDGYICGHDYLGEGIHFDGYGVNEAVNEFVEKNNFILSGLTCETKHKSYVISKNKESHDNLMLKVSNGLQ